MLGTLVGDVGGSLRSLLAGVVGVVAAALVAAGPGLATVTVVSRIRRREDRDPIRWAHLVFGLALGGIGVLLFVLAIRLDA